MKLPSIQSLWVQTTVVFKRFPLQFLIAIIATGIWWQLIDQDSLNGAIEKNTIKLLCICNLALTLLLAIDLLAEVKQYTATTKWGLRFIALLICGFLFYMLNPTQNQADAFRIGFLAFAFHLLVAFAPFIGKNNLNGFWQYNKTLFIKILTSGLYAAVLFGGLAVALAAIDGLFNVTINYKIYLKLFAFVAVTFNTIFFLASLPLQITALNQDKSYPKGLKVFAQYVLIPLVSIYLAILLVYELKIIINWELPKGMVSTLILGYSVFGILSLLLIYPIKNNEGNSWMKIFSKFFYIMMVPLVVLLLLSVVKRVGNYGITEPRYLLIILALWLTTITIYFIFSKKQNIKIIPISLCILALLAAYGPQSAFNVSKYSQIARLKKLNKSTNLATNSEKEAVVKYLVSNHGLTSIQGFTSINLVALENKIEGKAQKPNKNYYDAAAIKADTALALLKIVRTIDVENATQIYLVKENKEVILTAGYDLVLHLKTDNNKQENKIEGVNVKLEKTSNSKNKEYRNQLSVEFGKEPKFVFDLQPQIVQLYKQYTLGKFKKDTTYNNYYMPNDVLKFVKITKNHTFNLIITNLNGNLAKPKNNFTWVNFEGYLLIKKN